MRIPGGNWRGHCVRLNIFKIKWIHWKRFFVSHGDGFYFSDIRVIIMSVRKTQQGAGVDHSHNRELTALNRLFAEIIR